MRASSTGSTRRGWDGIHSDNWIYRIGVDWYYGSNLDTNRDGRVDDYATLRRSWAAGLTQVGVLLRSYLPGKIVGGNGNWNVGPNNGGIDFRPYLARSDDYLRSANYTLLERLDLYADEGDQMLRSIRTWLQYSGSAPPAAVLRRPPQASRRSHRLAGLRWGFSLATIGGAYYEAYTQSHDDRLWYDEYDGGVGIGRRHWLGKPLSDPQQLPGGVWRRDFEGGVVLNNSTGSSQTVALGGTFRRLRGTQDPSVNDGATVTEVSIGPRDGLFLARP